MDRLAALAIGLALALLACQSQGERATTSRPADATPAASISADTGATPARRWLPEGDGYIEERLKKQFGSAPALAWVVPPHRLLAEERRATARTWSRRGVQSWTYRATLPVERARELRHQYHVACESEDSLYEYTAEGRSLEYAERVLLVDSAGAEVRAGLVSIPAESWWMSSALAVLLAGRPAAAHRDTAFSAAAGTEFYSIHGAYDTSANADAEMGTNGEKYLVSRVLQLHEPGGTVIASHFREVDIPECDGCGVPTITDHIATVFSILQILQIPSFPHPVLLLNTSTVEGRALSLVTFDDAGEYRSYRLYEYVVNCF